MESIFRNTVSLAGLTFMVLGCSSRKVCDPGETQECVCAPGETGIQTCRESGSGWQPCDCSSTDTSTDGDVSGDVSGDVLADMPADGPCSTDPDCDNHIFCDGAERCEEGACVAGEAVECDDSDACTTDRCDEELHGCVFEPRDEDGDDHIDAACGGDDCDDTRDDAFPGSTALGCEDGVDQDCDTVVDDETLLATPEVLGPGRYHEKKAPEVVWTGTGFSVVWIGDDADEGTQVWFGRTDANGVVAGSPTLLASPSLVAGYPSLVWTGSEHGVAWQDDRDGGASEIYFARVDGTGTVLGAQVRVTDASAPSDHPSLAWTGTEFGLAWQDTRDGNWAVFFARLDGDGSMVGGEQPLTDASTHHAVTPRILWTGSEYALVWADNRDGNDEIYLARLDVTGSPTASQIRVTETAEDSLFPALEWTGTQLGVTWQDQRGGAWGIWFAVLSASGEKVSSDLLVRHIGDPSTMVYGRSAIRWVGDEYAICFHDEPGGETGHLSDVFLIRVPMDGTSYTPAALLTADSSDASASCQLAWTGSVLGLTWEHQTGVVETGILLGLSGPCR